MIDDLDLFLVSLLKRNLVRGILLRKSTALDGSLESGTVTDELANNFQNGLHRLKRYY